MTRRGLFRFILRGLAILAVVVVIIVGGLYAWLRTTLPEVSGTLDLPGLHAMATVTRDKNGVPHISAVDDHDAAFAFGFVQAQDRLFEMDVLRRYGEGRLSEFAGKGTLGRDRFMRTLGLAHVAQEQWKEISRPAQAYLAAFADGVNAYIAHHHNSLPVFYDILPGPAKWRPIDTLVIAKVMALYLSQNFHREIWHALIASRIPAKELHELFPAYPAQGLVTLARRAPALRGLPLEKLAAAVPADVDQAEASNNWVLAGRRTTSGRPILENDPHLTYLTPSIWYLARVDTPKLHLAGAAIPGTPFIIVGHNDHIGWGFTETGGDAEDLFVEKTDPAHPDRYLTPDGWKPFATRRETIKVKGGKDVTITVRSTRHGPVISDVAAPEFMGGSSAFKGLGGKDGSDGAPRDAKAAPAKDYALSLEATFLQPGDLTAQAFFDMDRAHDWASFREALKNWTAPEMNTVFADTGGTIGFIAAGRIPIRRSGDGWMPAPGWTDKYDWTGFVPFNAEPQGVNPPSGRYISANNKIVPDDYPYFITHDWAPPFRADRIATLLDARPKQSMDSTAAIAADVKSLMAKSLLPILLPRVKPDAASSRAVKILRAWNYDMQRGESAPLIFSAWLRELERELFANRLGPSFDRYWLPRPTVLENILAGQDPDWCGNGPGSADGCAAIVTRSLDKALQRLSKRFGSDPSRWRWGEAHMADFKNPVLSHVPLIGVLLRQSIAASGASETIDAGYMNFSDKSQPFQDISGPGLRMILDFSNLSKSRFLMAPGVSENFLSPHFGDLLKPWRNFQWMQIGRSPAVETLTLRPG